MNSQNFKIGTISDVGYEEYKGKDTFYLVLQDEKGNVSEPIRGKGLEEAFNKVPDLKKGDMVNLKDFGIDETTKKRIWEIERYEPYQELNNEISQDKEPAQQKSVDDFVKEAENAWEDKKERKPQDFDYIPDNIKNNYVGIVKNRFMPDEKINYYDKDDKDKMDIAFEDRKDSLNTSRQDNKTINAMLDLAESKGWKEIKLKGTEEFKQKAWLEASLRGIAVKGYEPNERDLAMLEASKAERSVNTVIAEKIENPTHQLEPVDIETTKEVEDVNPNQEKDLNAKEIAKDLAAETATVAVTPTPLQPVVAGAFLAKDIKEYADDKLQDVPQKSEKEIEQEIKSIAKSGIQDGSIKERSDLIEKLKAQGFDVVRENEKSLRFANPYGGKDILLKNDIFSKDYNAFKELENGLKPENIKEKYPKMSDENIAKVDLWRQEIFSRYETKEAQQNAMYRLNSVLPDVASGKIDLGHPIPPNEIKPEIEVRTPDSGDQSRSR